MTLNMAVQVLVVSAVDAGIQRTQGMCQFVR